MWTLSFIKRYGKITKNVLICNESFLFFCVLVNCNPGTYYADRYTCEDCERGWYQSLMNQTSCTQCALGLTTNTTRSTDIADCFGECFIRQWK